MFVALTLNPFSSLFDCVEEPQEFVTPIPCFQHLAKRRKFQGQRHLIAVESYKVNALGRELHDWRGSMRRTNTLHTALARIAPCFGK
ncbi:hypothetical protein AKG11_33435 [Shinella sp. SUS2]|nr:hypothetical protein AKG11_33435 [Shinella sp. SUS2]KOC71396.1 hypothetical protein AKG10_33320 [Shinella sp. GWS1]